MIKPIIIAIFFVALAVIDGYAEYVDPDYTFTEEEYFYGNNENTDIDSVATEHRFYKIKNGKKFYVLSTKKKKELRQFKREKGSISKTQGYVYEKIKGPCKKIIKRDGD